MIRSSMQEIFHEQYPFFACERIESLNEQVTMKEEGNHARAVDAMHGAHYFTITVSVCKTSGETVELYLKNDTSTAAYYLEGFRIK
ncbi:hypothetical protein JCM10914_2486 [Paenibacillus sp. JCM 10914]|nr:hypothetical protein JCM10914_2486 [Paenibacillus sp. JCM 10914]